jgi:hypothetical protein
MTSKGFSIGRPLALSLRTFFAVRWNRPTEPSAGEISSRTCRSFGVIDPPGGAVIGVPLRQAAGTTSAGGILRAVPQTANGEQFLAQPRLTIQIKTRAQ